MLKKILNKTEKITHKQILDVCNNHNVSVYPKIRLADIFTIKNSGITNIEYKYALQAHFDFLIADSEENPLFAIEYDGFLHGTPDQIAKDKMKNNLCKTFKLPLLRINAEYLNKNYKNMLKKFYLVITDSNSDGEFVIVISIRSSRAKSESLSELTATILTST